MLKKIVLILFLLSQFTYANQEHRVIECALTYRIIHFTQLPEKEKIYNLCIDSSQEDFQLFKAQLSEKKINNKELNVSKVDSSNIKKCNILYLGTNSILHKSTVVKEVKNRKILVFSVSKKYKDSSIVQFEIVEDQIRFNINKSLMDQLDIKMSSKVLRLASEVY